jgi:hypothetical protein
LVEGYLARVRVALRGLPEVEVDEILRELRSHIVEVGPGQGLGIESALRSLGDPVELAKRYRAQNQMAVAECSGSPLVILQGLRASRTGFKRVAATVLYVFGYINVVMLWAAALDKLFAPASTGLWHIPGRLGSWTVVTDGRAPAGARELLGWWFVPVAVLAGVALRYAIDRIAQWWIRRYRRSPEMQAP